MDTYTDLIRAIDEEIGREHAALAALSGDLFDHPEVSGQETETCRKMVSLLRDRGYQVETPFADLPTAFRGIFGSDSHTHKIAVLAEYDTLPEIGHACGHCLSGSISILAALALRRLQDQLDADVHIIGTPAEEDLGGKAVMVKKGVFDGYDMAMMVHLYDRNLLASRLLAMDSYMYHFYGRAAHASNAPWEGINALNAAQLMLHAMDMLRQHVKPDVRMHAVIRNGGEAPNIVPEEASVEVYVRALDRPYLNEVTGKVDDCARGAAIHTREFAGAMKTERAYRTLSDGAKLIARQVAKVFGDPGRLQAVKRDFKKTNPS